MSAGTAFAVHVDLAGGEKGVLIIKASRPDAAATEAMKRADVTGIRKVKKDRAGREG